MENAGQSVIEPKHIRVVHYYARRYVRANHTFYDDLVSAGMLALIRARNSYDAGKLRLFDAYVHVCVNRAVEREYMTLRARLALPLVLDPSYEKETHDTFDELIKGLDKGLRHIITLHYVEGLSKEEISDRLGYTRQWVSGRLKLALRILRDAHL